MGSLSRATNKTTTSMRAPGLSLLAAVISVSFSDALSTLNGRVDEDHNAIVVEALRARSGRAFSWFSGTPSSPFAGMFPAATQPLAPAALGQQVLCRTPGGALTFCQANYQWGFPGPAQGGFPGGQPGGFPGGQPGWPGQGGQWGQPQIPQQPAPGWPGQGGQWGQPQPQPVHQPVQPVQPAPQPTSPPVTPAPSQA